MPLLPGPVAVVLKNASPRRQELNGSKGLLGNEALFRLQLPVMVACPLMDAFRASPQPRVAATSIWWV
ncbi:hypothetical protein [Streptomyces sp. NPDC046197]|uniref:hypothetical protein n=1 Tax=Streptomyces sp. NPDC046197 TaxID=3154337 RepID=UPI0033E4CFEA